MGHKISKEQIDPGVKDHIMSFVGDVADLETEVNTDIISAVNSLMVDRVDNAENMGKLANAIGEPVTANHSVDEVVEGLGEMLSTFKTNMMNSGVMVESSDKFKQLIDKIKGLTEGEGNKGIQYTEGIVNNFVNNENNTYAFKIVGSNETVNTPYSTIDIDINNINMLTMDIVDTYNGDYDDTSQLLGIDVLRLIYDGISYKFSASRIFTFDNMSIDEFYNSILTGGSEFENNTSLSYTSGYMEIEPVSIDGKMIVPTTFSGTLYNSIEYTIKRAKYYAIGVGEEDTTLRDSLADILENKGVDVTEEDDMASLISKVDGLNLGGVDIISSASLPASVKDRQLVVVTDTPMTGAVFHNLQPSIGSGIQEGNIWINTTNNNDVFEYIVSDSPKFSFYILDCYQVISGSYVKKQIYCGVNGTWQHVNPNLYFIQEFINDKPLTKIDGSFANTYNAGTGCQRLRYNTNGGNHSVGGTHKTVKTFNTTGFSKVGIRFSATHASTLILRFYDVTTNSQIGYARGSSSTTIKTLELDIANINDLCYIRVDIDSDNNVSGDYIVDIYDLYLTN